MIAARTVTSGFASLLALACAAPPKVDVAAEANAVRQRFADWVAAEKRRDLDLSMSFLAPDAVIHGEGTPAIRGIEAARGVWKAFFDIPFTDIVSTEPRTVVVSSSGDLAYDAGSWRLIVSGKDGPTEQRGKSAIAWQKRDGQWKAVGLSFSMDSSQPLLPAAEQSAAPVRRR